MIKKVLSLLLCAALCGSLLAGCSDAPASSGVSSPSQAGTEIPAESIPDTPPVLEEDDDPDPFSEPQGDLIVRASVLKGPTAIGMVKLMSDAEAGTAPLAMEFTMSGSADEIVPAIVKGDIDIAAVPANLASVLYNRTGGGVEILAINNLGVLYIVESGEEINSVEDLRGRHFIPPARVLPRNMP